MSKKLLLDLFCGAGGLSKGYIDGGFKVIGIDSAPLREQYIDPDNFVQADALEVLRDLEVLGCWRSPEGSWLRLEDISVIHASAPCQGYSATKRFNPDTEYPMLIEPVRRSLKALGKPYIMENVEAAPLYATVTLCGAMFPEYGLRVYRHRVFETNFAVPQPVHNPHIWPQAKMGRMPKDSEFMHVVGHFPGMEYAKKAMGIDWMRRDELSEAVPPAYSRYIAPYALFAANR